MPARLEPVADLPGLFRWTSGLAGTQQPVHSYLWRRDADLVLIDPADDLTPAVLRQTGFDPADVQHILVTHLQAEHAAGSVHFSDAEVHVPVGDEYLAEGARRYADIVEPWPEPWDWDNRGNFKGHLAGALNERPPAQPIALFASLEPGESQLGVEVLATPGHGKHAVTLLADLAGRRVAFCGDLIFGNGQLWNWFDADWDYGAGAGHRALLASVRELQRADVDLLCPAHGPVIDDPAEALELLERRLAAILEPDDAPVPQTQAPVNFLEQDSPAPGFRKVLPHIHQWRTGNCAVLVSDTGRGLIVDDGLCHWVPLPERIEHHRETIEQLKRALDLERIEIVIPTHYHGDHLERIPDLVAMEGAEVVSLDVVADVIEHPERYNLACPLPWYGAGHDRVMVDRRVPSGTRFTWREYELEIFHLGGQTYYHAGIEVMVDDQRVIFAGDAIGGFGTAAAPVLCYNDNDPATRGWAYAMDRLHERKPDLLVCGHGIAVRDPMPLLEALRESWRQRLQQFGDLSPRETLRAFFDPFIR